MGFRWNPFRYKQAREARHVHSPPGRPGTPGGRKPRHDEGKHLEAPPLRTAATRHCEGQKHEERPPLEHAMPIREIEDATLRAPIHDA